MPSDQSDFPVLINLGTDSDLQSHTQPDADDILFTASDGSTKLSHEIESYDSGNGGLVAWVKVPSLSSTANTVLYLYYGNSSVGSQEDVANVWIADYVGIWHLSEEQAGRGNTGLYEDSTLPNYNGDDYTSSTGQDGRINGGQEFGGTGDYVRVPHHSNLNLTGPMTISFWIHPTGGSGSWNRIVEKGLFGYQTSYYFGGGDGTNDLTFYLNNTEVFDTADDVLTVDAWQHAAVTYASNGDATLFLDGIATPSGNYSGAIAGNTDTLYISFPDSTYDYRGFIDEVRIAGAAFSDDWIITEYNNQSAPSSFYALGSPTRIISGLVFEDANFAGTATDWDGGTNDAGQPNVDVELYDGSDVYVSSVTTGAGGTFSFVGLSDGSYKIRARSATIGDADGPPAGGLNGTVPATWPYPLPEMTWGNGGAVYGGQSGTTDDTDTGDDAGPGDTYVSVTVSGGDVTDVNLGFAYNLIVNTADDGLADNTRSDQGSLRQFLKNANAIGSAGGTTANSSEFRMQVVTNQSDATDNWWRITAATTLPVLSDAATTVDGSTQRTNSGTDSNSRGPEIELFGNGVAGSGLEVYVSTNTTIRELVLNSFQSHGVHIHGLGTIGTDVYGCYIGTDAIGEGPLPNTSFGIWITDNVSDTDIGGSAAGEGNLISGNGDSSTESGVSITLLSSDIRIRGNFIGTNRLGTAKIPNAGAGISMNGADVVMIGGATASEGNVISGNNSRGIDLRDWTQNVTIHGNKIGVGTTGAETTLGNASDGIYFSSFYDPSNNQVGGVGDGEGNLIAYNSNGIYSLTSGPGDEILGNTIRNNNLNGIRSGTDGLVIAKNLIWKNGDAIRVGVFLENDPGTSANNNKVYQNTIHDNWSHGIRVDGIGAIIRNNVITGNNLYGINVNGGTMAESYNDITDASTNPPNGSGRSNVALDATDLNADPLYVDEPGGDFTLTECTSPCINAGLDLGADQPDMNGSDAGLYNGAAPDMGTFETSCLAVVYTIEGIVFEDADYAGVASEWDGGIGDAALPNVDVELYAAADSSFITSEPTDGSGQFMFTNVADGTYFVRVRSASVGDANSPPDGGLNGTVPATWPYPLPEMTWADGDSLYGGQDATVDDTDTGDDAGIGDTHVQVTVSGGDVTNFNFGFAYNLIVNTVDDGLADTVRSDQGSLRQFLKNANAINGSQSSQFRIAGAAPYTVQPTAVLPAVDDPVMLDGWSEPDYAGAPVIVLDGSLAGAGADGLALADGSDGSTIRGLVIHDFSGNGIRIDAGADGSTIAGNYVGIDATGTVAAGNGERGLRVESAGNFIGGTLPGERNVISGNSSEGIVVTQVTSVNNTIVGNYFGLDASGGVDLGNGETGVRLNVGASGTVVGGTTAAQRNVISGNDYAGVNLSGSSTTGNYIQGNYIGTDESGMVPVGNSSFGIICQNGANNNLVGGTESSERNRIAHNGTGVRIAGGVGSTVDNAVLGNEIYSNTNLGLDVDAQGVTDNDPGDADTGPNDLRNFPEITSAIETAGTIDVDFDLDVPAGDYRIEFFKNPSGVDATNGEGELLASALTVSHGGSGLESFSHSFAGAVGDTLTATTTDSLLAGGYGSTSEFSAWAPVTLSPTYEISGTIFEDADFAGTASEYDGGIGDVGLPSVDIELYAADSSFVATVATNGSGQYAFSGLSDGNYFVRVRSASVGDANSPPAAGFREACGISEPPPGSECTLAELTWADGDSLYGGQDPLVDDGIDVDDGGIGDTHVQVSVSGGDVTDVNFGFSFNLVVNTNDTGQGSLRRYLLNAHWTNGPNPSSFKIPTIDPNYDVTGNGEYRIQPASALPVIRDPIMLDGFSQPGPPGIPRIEIDGGTILAAVNGLTLKAGNSTIQGFVISNFWSNGIEVDSLGTNEIYGNYIGTDVTGLVAAANWGDGIRVRTDDNRIGRSAAGDPNLISGNLGAGIALSGSGATDNRIYSNYIGTDRTGMAGLGNGDRGVSITAQAASNNIGGPGGNGNVISGNTGHGISIQGSGSSSNVILGNYIGIDATGTAAIPNTLDGVMINTDATSNTIGGTNAGEENVISGNTSQGIQIDGPATTGNAVLGNLIGTNVAGDAAVPNSDSGVLLSGTATSNTIGGTTAGAGNLISGNTGQGVWIDSGSGNDVLGNLIGTDAAGTNALPNTQDGVHIQGTSATNQIGNSTVGARNVISGNGNNGVTLTGVGVTGNEIQGNYIGTRSDGTGSIANGNEGVEILASASSNLIGGKNDGEGNRIANSGSDGIDLKADAGSRNAILRNEIFANSGMGIDLAPSGFNPNDGGDGDSGPNDMLNFPVITSAVESGGTIDVDFDLDVPNAFYHIEFFKNPSGSDPTGYGEGEAFADAVLKQDSSPGVSSFSHSFAGAVGDILTATCTECLDGVACTVSGSTSEFSAAVGVEPPPLTIVKRAFLPDSSTVTDGVTLAKGTTVHYLLYVNNDGPVRADASLRDILDASFAYQLQSMRVDNSLSDCTTGNCTAVEEQAIFEAVVGQSTSTDEVDGDVVSYTAVSRTIDAGNSVVGNAQLDVAGNSVLALLFTIEVQ